MSKFLNVSELDISDQELLVETLKNDVRFRGCVASGLTLEVESYETPQHLFGYKGDQRKQTAEVIIRQQFVGEASNDLGFKRQASGNFAPVISEYDSHHYNEAWRDGLMSAYSARRFEQEMNSEGFTLSSKTKNANGTYDMQFVEQGGW